MLYHVAIQISLYRKAVQVCDISNYLHPVTFSPSKLDFDPEAPGQRASYKNMLEELLHTGQAELYVGRHLSRTPKNLINT